MQHKQLSEGRWFSLTFFEQMANIGSEVERAISWKNKNKDFSNKAVDRALELLFLSIDDKKNVLRLKELGRVYESVGDYFYGDNIFKSSDLLWRKYFYNFAYAVRNKIL
jgi:hypothetical protein